MNRKPAATIVPDTIFNNGAFIEDTQAAKPDATQMRREEIIAYVKSRLGEDLAGVYTDAIRSSVSTGCYDLSWSQNDYARVEAYVAGLQQHWLAQQGDVTHILVKIQHLLVFGSDEQKEQLKTLLELA